MLAAVGAAPLRIDYSELYTALQQGTVAGMVTSIASVIDLKAWEVVTHANLTGFSTGGINSMAINMDTWNSLSPKHQAAMLRAAREVEDALRVDVPALERSGLDTLTGQRHENQCGPAGNHRRDAQAYGAHPRSVSQDEGVTRTAGDRRPVRKNPRPEVIIRTVDLHPHRGSGGAPK